MSDPRFILPSVEAALDSGELKLRQGGAWFTCARNGRTKHFRDGHWRIPVRLLGQFGRYSTLSSRSFDREELQFEQTERPLSEVRITRWTIERRGSLRDALDAAAGEVELAMDDLRQWLKQPYIERVHYHPQIIAEMRNLSAIHELIMILDPKDETKVIWTQNTRPNRPRKMKIEQAVSILRKVEPLVPETTSIIQALESIPSINMKREVKYYGAV